MGRHRPPYGQERSCRQKALGKGLVISPAAYRGVIMKHAAPVSATRDSVLARLMDDYLASCEVGKPLTADELASRYPELASDVAACLASLDFIRRAAGGAGVSPAVPGVRGQAAG